MFKSIILFVICAMVVFSQLACGSQSNNSANTSNNETVNKNAYYEAEEKKMFEESRKEFLGDLLKIANKQAVQRNIKPLVTQEFVGDDFEIRVWVGFAEPPQPKGFILEKKGEKWKAIYLPQTPKTEERFFSIPPKSDWDTLWRKIESKDVFTIPDSTELGRDNIYTDASLIFVEVKQGSKYRNYSYVQKDLAKNMNETQKQFWNKLKDVCFIISDEFRINLCEKE